MVRRDTGEEMPGRYEIVELDPPALLVLRWDAIPGFGPGETRIELHQEGDRTRMVLTDGPYPAGFTHAERGWGEAFAKLSRILCE